MNLMEFKKSRKAGLFHFLNVSSPQICIPSHETTRAITAASHFHYVLGLAEFLSLERNKFLLLTSFPLLSGLPFFKVLGSAAWKYQLIADDTMGLGIDKGFVSAIGSGSQPNALALTKDILFLSQLPEDSFGDKVSTVTVFSLHPNRDFILSEFLVQKKVPDLKKLLLPGELFIHIVTSKEQNYFNACLIISRDELEEKINSFQNVIDPNN